MSLSSQESTQDAALAAQRGRAGETTDAARGGDAIADALNRRGFALAAGEIYAFRGRSMVDATTAARLDLTAVHLALSEIGIVREGAFAAERLAADLAAARGLDATALPGNAPAPSAAADATELAEWAARLAFGRAVHGQDATLRAELGRLVAIDLLAFRSALVVALAGGASSTEDRALAVIAPKGAAVARAETERRVAEVWGVLNRAELRLEGRAAPRLSAWCVSSGKRVFDIVVSLGMLIGLSPLLLVIAAIMVFEKGPMFFGHTRVGKDGRTFRCLKFRTMIPNAEALLQSVLASDPALKREWTETRKLKNDPRVTALGRFLRKTSVDELPQLINVLRGDMSLVGVRPVTVDEAEDWGAHFAAYKQARPGLTGPWQIFFRSTSDYQSRFDTMYEYFRDGSLLVDLQMVAMTALTPFDTKKAC